MISKANACYEANDYVKSLQLYSQAVMEAERNNDDDNFMVGVVYICNIYNKFGNMEQCIAYGRKGLAKAKETNNLRMQDIFISNLVLAYCNSRQLHKADEYYEIQKNTVPPDTVRWKYYLLYNKARIHDAKGKYSDAVTEYGKAEKLAATHGMNIAYRMYVEADMAKSLIKLGRYAEALEHCRVSMDIARQTNDKEGQTYNAEIMYRCYKDSGNKELAGKYYNMYLRLSDSIFNHAKFFSASNSLIQYEEGKAKKRIISLSDTVRKQWEVLLAVLAFVLMLVMFVSLLYYKNKKLRRAHRLLISKNEELQKADKRNKALLQEMVESNAALKRESNKAEAASGKTETVEVKEYQESITDKSVFEELLNKIVQVADNVEMISDPEFSLATLAKAVGSNTKYVSQVINDTYGKNFKTYVNEKRIALACERLNDRNTYGHLTMQAIYESVGYTNSVSFIRSFKKVNGMTPTEYVRLTRDKE